MNTKVCIYCNVGHFIEVFEIQLEIAQQHLDRGDSVEFLFCDGFIPICEINIKKELETCLYCIGRRNSGISLLKGKVSKKNLIHFTKFKDIQKVKNLRIDFNSLEDLKNYKLESFDIGQAVYSSIADIKREHLPNIIDYKGEITKFIKAAGKIYFCMKNFIQKRKPDLVYIYNGRHALERPVIEACRKFNINFKTHEFAYNGGYELFENTLPQDLDARINQFNKITQSADINLIKKAGKYFFEKKVGFRQRSITFNKKRVEISINKYNALDRYSKENTLPPQWDSKKHNIIIFQSSEFEDNTAKEFYNHRKVYPSTTKALKKIFTEVYKRDTSIHFYLKLHPSFMFWENNSQEYDILKNLNLPNNVTLVLPDSKFDTYHLMNHADKVVAFRSTAGIESAYRGKPVIMLEDHIIGKLKSVYLANDHKHVIELICNKELPALPIDDALKYGYFNLFQGIIPKYYSRDPNKSYEENWGLFKGKNIQPYIFYQLLIKYIKLYIFYFKIIKNKLNNLFIFN